MKKEIKLLINIVSDIKREIVSTAKQLEKIDHFDISDSLDWLSDDLDFVKSELRKLLKQKCNS